MTLTNTWKAVRSFYEARQEPKVVLSLLDWYWRGLLICACVAIILAIGCGVWIFSNVLSSLAAGEQLRPAVERTPVSKQELRDALTAYDARVTRFEEGRGAALISDPS